jgi:hypothetical protein
MKTLLKTLPWVRNSLPFLALMVSTSVMAQLPPTCVTTDATLITCNSATLNGTVNANNSNTTVRFDWGLTSAYGIVTPGTPSPVTGTIVTPVSANLTGLTLGITYHYRIVGVNSGGTTTGSDMTFTASCAPPPTIPTLSQWKLIILSFLLLGVGMVFILRKSFA